ncbi:cyclophilin-like fold protein [Marinobacter sp. JSM 1782161]|uniref:cyclophilin-like fold protein n=1 Tax=Marinobacter sp. JSM 1782161 TaxID=2685906 RepID=UPI001404106E|nr:cyclophilin-like fold protein [Marinobacter sp. JSM 1782161]
MKIRIIVENQEMTAVLEDTPAARQFSGMLPLDLSLEDFHAIEKVADLPDRLSTDEAPDGYDPDIGDITYYAPWGNLAIFYRDSGYARGLVSLGRIEGSIDALQQPGPLAARIERVE